MKHTHTHTHTHTHIYIYLYNPLDELCTQIDNTVLLIYRFVIVDMIFKLEHSDTLDIKTYRDQWKYFITKVWLKLCQFNTAISVQT